MKLKKDVLGLDCGAGSIRGILGSFDGETLKINERSRFPNRSFMLGKGLYWDIFNLFYAVQETLLGLKRDNIQISSVGIDSWAQDFAIIDKEGGIVSLPRCYRDSIGQRGYYDITQKTYPQQLFELTGTQANSVCTLCQLYALKESRPYVQENGNKLLFIPGLITYFLTGELTGDSTIASMSLMYDNLSGQWLHQLMGDLGLSIDMLPPINPHFSIAGNIRDTQLMSAVFKDIPIITVANHDTGSAFSLLSVCDEGDTIYISCGSWTIIGLEIEKAVISSEAYSLKLCNERGLGDIMFAARNLTGLWIEQECQREWRERGIVTDYETLNDYALANRFESVIDTESAEFALPGAMNEKVAQFCRATGQKAPLTHEEIYSCVINSMAVKYAQVIKDIMPFARKPVKKICIVGGGSKKSTLCRLLSEYTGLKLIIGPVEAASIGNVMAQLISAGEIANMSEAGEVIKKSFEFKVSEDC